MSAQKGEVNYVRAYGEIEELQNYRVKPLARLVYSGGFEMFISFVILTNATSLAILTIPGISGQLEASCLLIDQICFWIYLVELGMRIASYGTKPWKFFSQGWNIFDFVVVGFAPFMQGQTTVLRLLRLLRLIRIFRFLPEVRILSRSIVKSIPPLMSMGVLTGLMLFLYGMAGYYLFGEQAPASWGSIGESMKSLFILLTLENFPVYLEEALAINPLALPFFLSYVFVVVFTVLNVLIGIVLNAMDEARAEDRALRTELAEMNAGNTKTEALYSIGDLSADEAAALKAHLKSIRES